MGSPDDPADYLLNSFAPGCAATQLPAVQIAAPGHRAGCRGSEAMYDGIDAYESSDLSARHKAAPRYVDALIWTPAQARGEAPSLHFRRPSWLS